MSDAYKPTNKGSSQALQSKTLNHLLSYPLVKLVVNYLLSFTFIQLIYQQLIKPVYDLVNQVVLGKFGNYIKPVDEKADQLLTEVVDKTVIPQGEKLVHNVRETVDYPLKTYVKPANDYTIKTVHQYLPDQQFKFDDNINELEKSVEIAKQLGSSLYNTVKTKLNEVSNNVLTTYKEEVAASKETSTIGKNISAGVNTAAKSYETYVKPLQEQTSAVINDVTQKGKAKTEELVDSAKNNISGVKKNVEATAEKVDQELARPNGAVSASA